MKMKVSLLAGVLLLIFMFPVFPAGTAVPGASLSGYWDLNFGDKSGRMTLGERSSDKWPWVGMATW